MINLSKNNLASPLIIFLILLSFAVSFVNLLNQGLYFKKENVDLPNATKKLVVDTIKRELEFSKSKKEVKNLENVVDEISYANQLGRLDAISLLLALFGIVIGFGAIFGFLHIKESSENIARSVAEVWIRENGERIKEEVLGKILMGVDIVKEAKQEAKKDMKEEYKNL